MLLSGKPIAKFPLTSIGSGSQPLSRDGAEIQLQMIVKQPVFRDAKLDWSILVYIFLVIRLPALIESLKRYAHGKKQNKINK